MTFRIVVGVDGSEHGNAALRWAVNEARIHEGEIVAVFAWQLPFVGIPGAFDRDEMERLFASDRRERLPRCSPKPLKAIDDVLKF